MALSLSSAQSPIKLYGGKTGGIHLGALPPLALYVHLPWCIKKCPYCDFNSHEFRPVQAGTGVIPISAATASSPSALPERRYLDALFADLESALPLIWGRPIYSIFIGGGTPSLFAPASIDALLAGIRARVKLAADAEITMEANPGTFETGRFAAFRQAGVNRLSIGVQSFDDAKLKSLGRVHDGAQARAAVAEVARCFDTFNLDLMYALPGQNLQECEQDLHTALSFAPPHLSLYHLTLEPNTYFARFPPPVPSDDAAADMQDLIEGTLGGAGYDNYEVSAYARPGHRAWHNLNYWTFGDYLGIGAGAHSKLSFPNRIVRQARHKHPERFMTGALLASGIDSIDTQNEIATADLPFEFMLNALRLTEGVALSLYTERVGLPLIGLEPMLQSAVAKGLLARNNGQIVPTAHGRAFLNDLQQLFLA